MINSSGPQSGSGDQFPPFLPLGRLPAIVAEAQSNLQRYLDEQEAQMRWSSPPVTLFEHSLRVARLAHRLALEIPDAIPEDAYIAGLFHDAGKFQDGAYHHDDTPEEERAAEVARRLLREGGATAAAAERITTALLDLYREEAEPGLLTQIVHDADNLDKLGFPGVANYMIKSGLRGRGLGLDLLLRSSIELTYARYATETMWTDAAQAIAAPRARRTLDFFRELLGALREDGLYNAYLTDLHYDDIVILAVTIDRCACGGEISRTVTSEKSIKCMEIRVEQRCSACDWRHKMRFCCPKMRRRKLAK